MSKFAVFDIDGTLIRWQLYHAVANKLAKKGILSADIAKRINDARLRWKRRESEDAFHQYEITIIELFEASLKSISHKVVDEAIDEVAKEYKSQVYVYTRNLARELKDKGYYLIAISGSHDEIVSHVAKNYGFDTWVGSMYERKDDGFSGKRFIASQNKKEILSKIIEKNNLTLEESYAVGDTANDAPILSMVENPIAFNPNRALYEIATKNGWKIVVERKNVIYELEKQGSNRYNLL